MSGRDLHPGPSRAAEPSSPATASAELPSLPPGAPGGWGAGRGRRGGGGGAGRGGTGGGAGARTLRLLRLELETPAAWDEGRSGWSLSEAGRRLFGLRKVQLSDSAHPGGDSHPAWTCRRGSLRRAGRADRRGGRGPAGPEAANRFCPPSRPRPRRGDPTARLLFLSQWTRHKTDAALSTRSRPARPRAPAHLAAPRGTGMSRAAPIAARTLAAAEEVRGRPRARPGPGAGREGPRERQLSGGAAPPCRPSAACRWCPPHGSGPGGTRRR